MRTIFVVDDAVLQSLTSIARTAALTELKRVFDFVGQVPRERPVTVSVLVPSAFPEKYDLSDGVIRLTASEAMAVQTSMRQQSKIVEAALARHHISLPDFSRSAGTPERLGTASQLKTVQPVPGGKVAVVLMAAEVSLPLTAADYSVNSAQPKDQIEGRRDFSDGKGGTDVGKMARYFSSSQALRDTRDMILLDNPTAITEWTGADQQRFGVVAGRAMAHEIRHLIVTAPPHAVAGLGASDPDLLDDKNYADFSADDQKSILTTMKQLEASQSGAVIIPTFPREIRKDPDSFPF